MDQIPAHINTLFHLLTISLAPNAHSHQSTLYSASTPVDSILLLDRSLLDLLRRQVVIVTSANASGNDYDTKLVEKRLDDLLEIARGKFYAYPFKDVPEEWRRLYTDSGCLKAISLLETMARRWWPSSGGSNRLAGNPDQGQDEPEGRPPKRVKVRVGHDARNNVATAHNAIDSQGRKELVEFEVVLDKLVETLDLVLIMSGAPGPGRKEWIHRTFSILESLFKNSPYPWSSPKPAEIAATEAKERVDRRIRISDDYYEENGKQYRARIARAECLFTDKFPPISRGEEPYIPRIERGISRVKYPSMEDFQRHMWQPKVESLVKRPKGDLISADLGALPVIITGTIEGWPARTARPWRSPRYLLKRTLGGRRRVPIEVGKDYTDGEWGQKIMRFGEFLEGMGGPKYGSAHEYAAMEKEEIRKEVENEIAHDKERERPKKGGAPVYDYGSDGGVEYHTGFGSNPYKAPKVTDASELLYLAQTPLFEQFPELRKDLSVPDYCFIPPPPPSAASPFFGKHSKGPAAEGKTPELEEPILNAWLGPKGTVSPLHVDPRHNLLAQVVGCKYVRLYPPGAKMYQCGKEATKNSNDEEEEDDGVDMSNTSRVDVGLFEGWEVDAPDESSTDKMGYRAPDDPDPRGVLWKQMKLKRRKEEYRARFPGFGDIEGKEGQGADKGYLECILEEDEMLYIPVGWWHYVRSLDTSFSVSLWWN